MGFLSVSRRCPPITVACPSPEGHFFAFLVPASSRYPVALRFTTDHTAMHTLCLLEDLPEGSTKGFDLDGTPVFAVHHAGKVHVYRNHCPHLGIPLEWVPDQFLDVTGTLLQCASHGALFLIESGRCVAGPCTGQSLKKLLSEVVDGEVRIVL